MCAFFFSSVQNLRRIPAVILSGRYSMQGRVCGKLAVIFKVPIVYAKLKLKILWHQVLLFKGPLHCYKRCLLVGFLMRCMYVFMCVHSY